MANLTQAQANELFEYNDGSLLWKNRANNLKHCSKNAGHLDNDGYLRTRVNGKLYLNHRIIFLMKNGYFPKLVDHIDGNKLNNKIENLREATKSQNSLNKKTRIDSKSGIKNVYWYKPTEKWKVAISINQKRKHIGYFESLELAELVSLEASNKFHGAFQYKGIL